MKIYVASSWRNELQPQVVTALRALGHDVYDFRNPPGKTGFSWRQVQDGWTPGTPVNGADWRNMVDHPVALEGYDADMKALRECEACVYVLPCGRSASWEFGYAMGEGKKCFVVWIGEHEPELMFREATVITSMEGLGEAVGVAVAFPGGATADVPLSKIHGGGR